MNASTKPAGSTLPSMVLIGLLGLTPVVDAQWSEQHKLLPDDGAAGDVFGSAVATDGALVVAGAPSANHSGPASGSAYVFGAGSGAQHLELVPMDGAPGDQFGSSVAVDGTRVVVGAPLADGVGPDSGAAYVFDATSGLQLFKLEPTDAVAGDQAGFAVSMDGGLAVIGSLGAAYVFDVFTGQQLEKLLPIGGSTTLGLSGFGEAVDIDGGRVVVGARLENGVSGISGAAYVYDASNGDQLHRLVALNGTAWAFFGACVSIDESVIAIGAPEAGPKGKHSGAAYVFDAASGQQVHYLFPADGHVFAKFGSSVGVDGQELFIGSEQNNDGGLFAAGSVYLYDVQGGSQADKLSASDPAANDELGGAVAVAGGTLVAGAIRDDDNGVDSGSVYVFGDDPLWQDLGGGTVGSNGPPALAGSGPLTAGSTATLQLVNAPPGALMLAWLSLTSVPVSYFGGTIHAIPFTNQFLFAADPAGGFTASTTWPPSVPSGTEAWFQFIVQDNSSVHGLTLSNGLKAMNP